MKIRKLVVFSLLALILALTALVAACTQPAAETPKPPTPSTPTPSTPTPTPPEKPIVLKYGSPFPDVNAFSVADMRVLEKIEQETNGRVQFETYFGGTLISFPEGLDEISKGVCDIGTGILQMAPSGLDILKWIEGAYYGCPDLETELRVCDEVNVKYPELEGDYANFGKLLTRSWGPPYQLDTRERINTLEDIRGKSFRTVPVLAMAFKELGGEGLTIPMGEAYTSLEKGILDGCTGAHEQLISGRWGEVTKYHCELNIRCGGQAAPKLMNWDTWNSLPPDIQKVFEDNWGYWREANIEEMLKGEQAGIDFALENGGVFYELPPEELAEFYEILDSIYLAEMAKLDDKGLPGTVIYQEIRHLIEEYSK